MLPVDPRRTIPASIVSNADASDAELGSVEPRDAGITRGYAITCPGCGVGSWLPLQPQEPDGWTIVAGEFTTCVGITLSPSILNRCCGWHGYLTGGVFVSL